MHYKKSKYIISQCSTSASETYFQTDDETIYETGLSIDWKWGLAWIVNHLRHDLQTLEFQICTLELGHQLTLVPNFARRNTTDQLLYTWKENLTWLTIQVLSLHLDSWEGSNKIWDLDSGTDEVRTTQVWDILVNHKRFILRLTVTGVLDFKALQNIPLQ